MPNGSKICLTQWNIHNIEELYPVMAFVFRIELWIWLHDISTLLNKSIRSCNSTETCKSSLKHRFIRIYVKRGIEFINMKMDIFHSHPPSLSQCISINFSQHSRRICGCDSFHHRTAYDCFMPLSSHCSSSSRMALKELTDEWEVFILSMQHHHTQSALTKMLVFDYILDWMWCATQYSYHG